MNRSCWEEIRENAKRRFDRWATVIFVGLARATLGLPRPVRQDPASLRCSTRDRKPPADHHNQSSESFEPPCPRSRRTRCSADARSSRLAIGKLIGSSCQGPLGLKWPTSSRVAAGFVSPARQRWVDLYGERVPSGTKRQITNLDSSASEAPRNDRMARPSMRVLIRVKVQ